MSFEHIFRLFFTDVLLNAPEGSNFPRIVYKIGQDSLDILYDDRGFSFSIANL